MPYFSHNVRFLRRLRHYLRENPYHPDGKKGFSAYPVLPMEGGENAFTLCLLIEPKNYVKLQQTAQEKKISLNDVFMTAYTCVLVRHGEADSTDSARSRQFEIISAGTRKPALSAIIPAPIAVVCLLEKGGLSTTT